MLGGLEMVIQSLDRTLESIPYRDVELARMVVADGDWIDGRSRSPSGFAVVARAAGAGRGDLRHCAVRHLIDLGQPMHDRSAMPPIWTAAAFGGSTSSRLAHRPAVWDTTSAITPLLLRGERRS